MLFRSLGLGPGRRRTPPRPTPGLGLRPGLCRTTSASPDPGARARARPRQRKTDLTPASEEPPRRPAPGAGPPQGAPSSLYPEPTRAAENKTGAPSDQLRQIGNDGASIHELQTSVRNFTLVFLFQLVTCEPMVLAGKNFDSDKTRHLPTLFNRKTISHFKLGRSNIVFSFQIRSHFMHYALANSLSFPTFFPKAKYLKTSSDIWNLSSGCLPLIEISQV